VSALFHELLRAGVYKRSQGRITRQVTFAALALGLAVGLWRLKDTMATSNLWLDPSHTTLLFLLRIGVPGLLLLLGWWVCYRLVNLPVFADFLIAVEAEMNKVSWPSRGELYRASLVVLITLFALAALLFAYDVIWKWLLHLVGILRR
jgi:preprotein translocase subunit SecE